MSLSDEGYLLSLAAGEYGCYAGYTTKYARHTGREIADIFLDMLK